MKTIRRTFFAIAAVALLMNPTSAGLMDESDCITGPTIYGLSDLSDRLRQLDDRIVACFNYSQEVEVKNHNRQEDTIENLERRVSQLESLVTDLEKKIDDLGELR